MKLNCIDNGIITKESKVIPYDKIQNAQIVTGPLMSLFGISLLKIWTASPSQIRISGDNGKSQAEHIPDGSLFLTKEDAEWLRDHLTR